MIWLWVRFICFVLAMIAVGAVLIAKFHWVLYVFGAFLIVTAIKMLVLKTDHNDPDKNIVVRLARRLFPITARFHGEHFVLRAGPGIVRKRCSGKRCCSR